MKRWLKRVRGILGMGLIWGLAWGIVGGAIMEGIVDPHGEILDMWPQALTVPGFLLGVVFAVMLSLTDRRRRFDELSIRRFAGLGAVAGAVLGSLFVAAGMVPIPDLPGSTLSGLPLWLRTGVIVGPMAALSAACASGSLMLARVAQGRQLAASDTEGASPALPPAGAKERSGGNA